MLSNLKEPILVTGAAGFIGSNFVRLLVSQGYQRIVVLDALTYAGHRENLEDPSLKESLEFVRGNIADTKLVSELLKRIRPSAMVNFAAESHVDRSIDSPGAFIDTNVYGVFSLLNASLDYWTEVKGESPGSFRLIQVSTDEVYGSLGPEGKFTEKTPFAPNSPYSASKASGDLLARAWFHTYGLPVVVTNCSNNYGARQFPEKLIPYMIHCALEGRPMPVYGDGGNIRDWIHVEDHCSGVLLALQNGKPGETYCFGGNSERNNLAVVKAICELLDRRVPRQDSKSYLDQIAFVEDRKGHDRRYAIDDSYAVQTLGFRRKYSSFEEGLAETVDWYLSNREWCATVLKKSKGLDI